jgi:Arc/MetJ family transcription regulator
MQYEGFSWMRITVDIDEAVLAEVMALTGETQKSPALSKAILEFTYRRRAKEFGRLIREGAFDYPDPTEDASDPGNPVPPLTRE